MIRELNNDCFWDVNLGVLEANMSYTFNESTFLNEEFVGQFS